MKHQKKRILAALLALVLCMGLLMAGAVPATAAQASGYCGNDLTWTLENGLLTISGTGPMDGYNDLFVPPWQEYADHIQRVVVTEGVTSIGNRAFQGLTSLRAVTLAPSVKSLGAMAFAECTSLAQITMPGVESIGISCFHGCIALVNITLPDGLRTIGDQAFYRCEKLSGITIPKTVEQMGIMVFSYCKRLVYVDIRARLAVLPHWTFYGCVMLWEVYLPSSIELVDANAFGECPSLYYVDYGGSGEVKEEISEQLSQPTTMVPEPGDASDVIFTEHENATITTTITTPTVNENGTQQGSSTTIDATITKPEGWKDVVQEVVGTVGIGREPEVVVQVQDNLTMEEGALSDLSGKDVTVTVQTSQNVDWEIIMKDQTEGSLNGAQDFNVTIGKNSPDAFKSVLGGATSYSVSLGYTSLYTTVRFPLGKEVNRQVATLYRVNGDNLEKLSSVLVDDDGMAAYSLAGTKSGTYIIALNVPGISKDEVIIPKSLAAEYGIDNVMLDAQGTKYIVTGMTNELGFGIGTLTLIILGVLVGSAVVVGAIMITWNKQKKKQTLPVAAERKEYPPHRQKR